MQVRDLLYDEGFTIAGAKRRLRGGSAAEAEKKPAPAPAAAAKPEPVQVIAAASGVDGAHVRETLLAVKREIEAFLDDELGGS